MGQVKLNKGSNLVTVDRLYDATQPGVYLSGATVVVTVYELDGTAVAFSDETTWPITCSYVSGSDGKYQGTIPKEAALVIGRFYNVEVTVSLLDAENTYVFRRRCEG